MLSISLLQTLLGGFWVVGFTLILLTRCCLSDGTPRHAALPSHGNAPHGSETTKYAASAARYDASDDAPHGRTTNGAGEAVLQGVCLSVFPYWCQVIPDLHVVRLIIGGVLRHSSYPCGNFPFVTGNWCTSCETLMVNSCRYESIICFVLKLFGSFLQVLKK